jgi:hypothetical protein
VALTGQMEGQLPAAHSTAQRTSRVDTARHSTAHRSWQRHQPCRQACCMTKPCWLPACHARRKHCPTLPKLLSHVMCALSTAMSSPITKSGRTSRQAGSASRRAEPAGRQQRQQEGRTSRQAGRQRQQAGRAGRRSAPEVVADRANVCARGALPGPASSLIQGGTQYVHHLHVGLWVCVGGVGEGGFPGLLR